MTHLHTKTHGTSERVIVHKVTKRRAKRAALQAPHRDLRIAIVGASPLACALARAIGKGGFTNVTLFTNGSEPKTFSYINATLLHRVYSFLRETAFPDSQIENVLPRYQARIPRLVRINRSRILSIDPKAKKIVSGEKHTSDYDILLFPADDDSCTLKSEETPHDIYIHSGESLLTLHRTLAERVANTPKREFIDVWCDASHRLGKELSVTIAEKLPVFASKYGHPRETVHVHGEKNKEPHEEELQALRIHLHARPSEMLVNAGALLAHPGHMIIPPFSTGLSAVDVTHEILMHIALHPMSSTRFTVHAEEFFYTASNRAGNTGEGTRIGWVTLRMQDLIRATRAYGVWAGVHAWRGMRV